jgi:tetratricopeptide (TPR) repeat protein
MVRVWSGQLPIENSFRDSLEIPIMINQLFRCLRWNRSQLAAAGLGLLFLVVMAPPGRCDDPPEPERLTPQQREELERQANALNQGSFDLYRRGAFGPALEKSRQALRIRERLYPQSGFPQGHTDLVQSLSAVGFLLKAQGDYTGARGHFQRSLAMCQALYPKAKYPQGHRDLAQSLNNLGFLLKAQGDYTGAQGYYQRALAMRQALYPKERYPQGHPELATSLNNLASLLQDQGSYGEARGYYQRALAMTEGLYPKERYPQGHPELAQSLNNLGVLLQAQGSYGEARGYYQRALAMTEGLYPKEQYPQGHPELANYLNTLGSLLQAQGDYSGARGYYQRALAMRQALYPKEQYPRGHPELAHSLNSLGVLLHSRGPYGEARGYLDRALAMRQALYPKEKYPQGHPNLAISLDNLGSLLKAQGDHGGARAYYQRALAMEEALYPKEQYPQGHPDLAISLNNLGSLLDTQGSYDEARGYYQRALAMRQALYPKEQYPQGHPHLAQDLNNLGRLVWAEGSAGEAWGLLQQAVDMQQDLADLLVAVTAEAEALDYLAQLPRARDHLIAVSLHVPDSDAAAYARVWRGKAAVARILRRRQAALVRLAAANPDTRQTVEAWRDTRGRLARLLLAMSDGRDHPQRLQRLQQLTAEKERLERELAEAIPEFARTQTLARSPYTKLVEALPERTVVFDLVQFTRFEQDPQIKGKQGERRTPSYVGFVLAKGQPVRQVDLGPAQAIDEAVRTWRQAIEGRQPSPAGEVVRRRVWEPLAKHLSHDTKTVVIAPDGALTQIPWGALPGDRPGTVLLEQYALATVPHAPFFLERLIAPPRSTEKDDRGILLAVGGVAYDQAPKPLDDEKTQIDLLAMRQAETERGQGDGWQDLPGTLQELNAAMRLAGARTPVRLQGTEASTAQLLREMPRARWAHIATHGFFADPKVRSVLQPDPKLFSSLGSERGGAGLRNPLVLSGLVLAGANRPSGDVNADRTARDDLGILTAEAIAGLPLQDLELVVLSACETGLGLVGGGEGVFGLQRAFHLAGAHNVVASLWKVEDEATAALMAVFYDQLWRQNKPPIEALRTAQLTIYRHPERIGELTQARGTPDFDKLVQHPEPVPGGGDPVIPARDRAPVKQWAAFVLSGWGR